MVCLRDIPWVRNCSSYVQIHGIVESDIDYDLSLYRIITVVRFEELQNCTYPSKMILHYCILLIVICHLQLSCDD